MLYLESVGTTSKILCFNHADVRFAEQAVNYIFARCGWKALEEFVPGTNNLHSRLHKMVNAVMDKWMQRFSGKLTVNLIPPAAKVTYIDVDNFDWVRNVLYSE